MEAKNPRRTLRRGSGLMSRTGGGGGGGGRRKSFKSRGSCVFFVAREQIKWRAKVIGGGAA